MLHSVVLAASDNIEAAGGFILRGIKGIFVAIGSIIAAVICAVIAGMKGRNPFGWGPTRAVLLHPDADRDHRDPEQEVVAPSGEKPRKHRLHPDVPAAVHRIRRLAQPPAGLLNGQTLCQGEQYVRDVDRIAGQ